ncbi:hypothetical protein MZH95_000843 [Salmonella enterica]|nr:hypothetical protein [Salmonella enterica]
MKLEENLIICRKLRGHFNGNKTGITGIRVIVEKSEHPLIQQGIQLRLFDERKGVRSSVRWISEGALLVASLTYEPQEPLWDAKALYAVRHYQILMKSAGGSTENLLSEFNKWQLSKINQLKDMGK